MFQSKHPIRARNAERILPRLGPLRARIEMPGCRRETPPRRKIRKSLAGIEALEGRRVRRPRYPAGGAPRRQIRRAALAAGPGRSGAAGREDPAAEHRPSRWSWTRQAPRSRRPAVALVSCRASFSREGGSTVGAGGRACALNGRVSPSPTAVRPRAAISRPPGDRPNGERRNTPARQISWCGRRFCPGQAVGRIAASAAHVR